MRPLLAQLADDEVWTSASIRRSLAKEFQLAPEDLAERNPSGRNRFTNLVAWALHHLYRAKLVQRVRASQYQITSRGREVLQKHPRVLDVGVCAEFDEWHHSRTQRTATHGRSSAAQIETPHTRTSRRSTATAASESSAPPLTSPNGQVDRDLLAQTLFPHGVPARADVIHRLSAWLDEAEQLRRDAANP
jgi:restriction system protein